MDRYWARYSSLSWRVWSLVEFSSLAQRPRRLRSRLSALGSLFLSAVVSLRLSAATGRQTICTKADNAAWRVGADDGSVRDRRHHNADNDEENGDGNRHNAAYLPTRATLKWRCDNSFLHFENLRDGIQWKKWMNDIYTDITSATLQRLHYTPTHIVVWKRRFMQITMLIAHRWNEIIIFLLWKMFQRGWFVPIFCTLLRVTTS